MKLMIFILAVNKKENYCAGKNYLSPGKDLDN